MSESSTIHLPAACPEWCVEHDEDLDEGPTLRHISDPFELMTLDGPVSVTLERGDGYEDGSGVTIFINGGGDFRIEEARRLAAQLIAWADLAE